MSQRIQKTTMKKLLPISCLATAGLFTAISIPAAYQAIQQRSEGSLALYTQQIQEAARGQVNTSPLYSSGSSNIETAVLTDGSVRNENSSLLTSSTDPLAFEDQDSSSALCGTCDYEDTSKLYLSAAIGSADTSTLTLGPIGGGDSSLPTASSDPLVLNGRFNSATPEYDGSLDLYASVSSDSNVSSLATGSLNAEASDRTPSSKDPLAFYEPPVRGATQVSSQHFSSDPATAVRALASIPTATVPDTIPFATNQSGDSNNLHMFSTIGPPSPPALANVSAY